MEKDSSLLYRVCRPIIKIFFLIFFTPKIVGKENIPVNGRVVLAGTHTNIFDCLFLISCTKRSIHFLAKKELFLGRFGFIFSNMGLIPVDRGKKDPSVLEKACYYLRKDNVIGIFPEGTIGKNGLLPFKIGAVKMAYDTNSSIVPFVITGKYKLFSRSLKIVFLKQFFVTGDLERDNENLRNIILESLKEEV